MNCFVDNRLSIHFGEDKTIHSASRQKRKKFPELKQTYKNIKIKQYSKPRTQVAYLIKQ